MAEIESGPPGEQSRHPLARTTTNVGRDPSNDIVLDDPAVSRFHAVIEWEHSCFWVRDLASRNGTTMNGMTVGAAMPLRDGAQLRLGGQLLTFIDRQDPSATIDAGDGLPARVPLTAREREIIERIARGDTDRQIAAALYISVATVRSHLERIRDKTGMRRRAELARLAAELGPLEQ